jgi:hypothetical protein
MSGVSPESVFRQAVGFYSALQILMKKKNSVELVAPVCVLAAFTIELMFKCLICIERDRSPPRGHDLLALFDKLSAPTRERLEAKWAHYVQTHRHPAIPRGLELRSELAKGREAFELIRYMHEGPPKEDFAFFLCDLPDMLIQVVFELRPDWARRAWLGWRAPQQSGA